MVQLLKKEIKQLTGKMLFAKYSFPLMLGKFPHPRPHPPPPPRPSFPVVCVGNILYSVTAVQVPDSCSRLAN